MSRPVPAARSPRDGAVERLRSRVLNHSPSDLWHFFDRLTGRPEVAAAGWTIRERRLSPRPCEERDAKMTALHDGGLRYAEIASAYHVSRAAVAKAVQRYRRRRDSESLSTLFGD